MFNILNFSPFRKRDEGVITIEKVLAELQKHHKDADVENVRRAFEFAKRWHGDQQRDTGEPFITHPLNVAYTLAKMQLGENTIIPALLHDLHEDTPVSIDEIQREFGVHIANIVDGVTKLGKVKFTSEYAKKDDLYYSNLQKMFMAMSKDIRVIIIKLADRLHNMETLQGLPAEHQQRKAHETMEIYAPIANRLGMGEIKGQLEDLAFMYIYPKEYEWLIKTFRKNYQERKKYIDTIQHQLKRMLTANKIDVVAIEGRAKHLYSLYKKLQRHDGDMSKIYDLIAIRIILKDTAACYHALGIIHQKWKPLVGRIKDYIATPKPNGYKSLHTTVFALDGKIVEIQIRTEEMHREAEFGIAAHWIYSDSKQFKDYVKRFLTKSPEDEMRWVKELSKWRDAPPQERELMIERLRVDTFSDRLFVFTPKGDVRDLPEGATVIDFAYTIHAQVGHHAKSALINNKPAKLFTKLKNGDIVNVVTDKKQKHPEQAWLEFAKTDQARSEIRKWLVAQNAHEHRSIGEEILNTNLQELLNASLADITAQQKKEAAQMLHLPTFEKLLEEIGSDRIHVYDVIKRLYSKKQLFCRQHILFRTSITEKTQPNNNEEHDLLIVQHAPCCCAKAGEMVVIETIDSEPEFVHARTCPVVKKRTRKRIGYWVKETKPRYCTDIHVATKNRIGLLRDLAEVMNNNGVNIEKISTSKPKEEPSQTDIAIEIDVWGLHHLKTIIEEVKKIDGVLSIRRHRHHLCKNTLCTKSNPEKNNATRKTSSTK